MATVSPHLASNEYTPGMCNIGPAERRMRRRSGFLGLIVTLVVLIILLATDVHWAWRLVLVVPATVGALGFLQDRLHFCVGFGMKGIFNVINSAGVTDNVELEAFRQADRRKAIKILFYSLAIGLIVTALAILLV